MSELRRIKSLLFPVVYKRILIILLALLPLLLLGVWLMRLATQPAHAATADWTAIAWNDTTPLGPATQSFINVDGIGVDIDIFYSGNMWDNNSVPNIYSTTAKIPQLQPDLRWTSNTADVMGAPGSATGPSRMVITFSAPIYLDQFTVGSLSNIIGGTPRYEWGEITAFDENNLVVFASNIITSTYVVTGTSTYSETTQVAGSPAIIDDGSGTYRAGGRSIQSNGCTVGCGYDRATFVYDITPVSRIEVLQYVTTGVTYNSARPTGNSAKGSIVFEPIRFRLAEAATPAAIGNYVWLDEDANGRQDTGESGIPNVIVNLTDAAGTVFTTTTDSDGGYLFGRLNGGSYTITLPALNSNPGGALEGLSQTTNPLLAGADFGNQTLPYSVTVAAGEENLTADFGYIWNPADVNGNTNNAALGDRVWVDVDSDGVQDPSEIGIAGVTVNLIGAGADGRFNTADDVTLASDVTDANGRYSFPTLTPNGYIVRVDDTTLPAGYVQTGDPDEFGQPATSPDHQTTNPVILGPGDVFLNADFGYNPAATPVGRLGTTIWFDADASGTQEPMDAGEYGIAGVSVALIQDTNGDGVCNPGDGTEPIIARAVTDASGMYLFDGLPLDDGGGDSDADYIVWVNDTDNVLASLVQTFDFDGVGTPNCSATALSVGTPQDLDQDFSYTPLNHTNGEGVIGDTIWLDADGNGAQNGESGIEGVIVTLTLSDTTSITTTTDENGRYTFGGLDPSDTYTVTVAPQNFNPNGVLEGLSNTADPDGGVVNQSVVDLSITGPIDLDQDFGYTPVGQQACVGNLVWLDPNADGFYDGPNGPDLIFGTDDDEPIIAGVTVDLYRDLNGNTLLDAGEPKIGTAVTSAVLTDNGCFPAGDLGNYIFTGLPTGDFIIDVTDVDNVLAGYWHSRGTDGLTNNSQADPYALSVMAGEDNLTADFGYYLDPASLGNRVWFDTNANGIQDAAEPGLAGVEVVLTIAYPDMSSVTVRTTTDGSGIYSFPNLLRDEDYNGDVTGPEPTYTITVPSPVGFQPTPLLDFGGNDRVDADDPMGVTAVPTQGLTDVGEQADPNNEPTIASYDFGFINDTTVLSALGNIVWLDEDADGLQDAGEAGIANVIVNLTDNVGMVMTTTTDVDGGYLFDRLPAGTYTVTIPAVNGNAGQPLEGLAQTVNPTLPNDDFGNQALPYQITLGTGDENLTADFGYIWNPADVTGNMNSGALGDRVWVDMDSDGVQDPNEVGIEGVTVNLIEPGPDNLFGTADDVASGTDVTDVNGRYSFPNLPAGAYIVEVDDTTLPAGFTQTGDPDEFGQPATAPDDRTTDPVLLGPGDVFLNADFGYNPGVTPVGTIGDTIWFDADASGTAEPMDAGEYGIAGVTVVLIKDLDGNGICSNAGDGTEPIIARDVTDANGNYLFEGLPLDDGGGDNDADYIVWVNDTDNVLAAYSQTFDDDGIGTQNCSATALDAGTIADLDQDFSYTPLGHINGLGAIGDTIWLNKNGDTVQDADEPGIEGVAVTLTFPDSSTRTAVTDENGRYSFGSLNPNDSYTVTVDATNFNAGSVLEGLNNTADPDSGNDDQSVVDLAATGPVDLDQDFGYTATVGQIACVGNLVWLDPNANGTYDGVNGLDALFGTDDDEPAIGGVTVDLYRDLNNDGNVDAGEPKMGTAVTSATASNNGCVLLSDLGNYIFDELPAGNYVVDVTDVDNVLAGYWQSRGTDGLTDESQADPYGLLVAANSDNLTADFGYYVQSAAVGNRVWFDLDGDGLQDGGEPGLPNVVVELSIVYPDATVVTVRTTTDANGIYRFPNLLQDEGYNGDGAGPEPTFSVSVQTPNGFANTTTNVNANANDLEDSDDPTGVAANPIQGLVDTSEQTPPTNEPIRASYDFGFIADPTIHSALGNFVWLDEDADGRQDAGEPGIPNVTMNLQDNTGAVISTTVTDANGGYLFPRLSAGVYTVTLDSATLPAGVSQTINPVLLNADFGNQSLPYQIVLGAGDENLTGDFGYIWNPTNVTGNDGNGAIGDTVWIDGDGDGVRDPNEAGVANVLLNLIDAGPDNLFGTADDLVVATTMTDVNGRYIFSNLAPDGYLVQVASVNFNAGNPLETTTQTGDPDEFGQPATAADNLTTTPIILAPGDVFLNADFGYQPTVCGVIGDTVWFDANASGTLTQDIGENGIAGVTVALIQDSNGDGVRDAGEPILATAVTDASGNYLFPCLPLDDGGGDNDFDYLVWVNDTDNILQGLAQTYDESGVVGSPNLSDTALSAATPSVLTQDFSYTPRGHTGADGLIGDTIYLDISRDGAQGAGEPGLEGVLVTLTLPAGAGTLTTVTDENGRYAFGGLNPTATYTVTVDTTGLLAGMDNTGDPDGGNDSQSVVDLNGSGPIDLAQDFGYAATLADAAQIGNLVWLDSNTDGTFTSEDGADAIPATDDDEPIIAGITIDLYRDLNSDGDLDPGEPRINRVTTDSAINAGLYGADGVYLFDGVPSGDYIVDVSDQAGVLLGHWQSLGTADTNNESQPDPNGVTVATGGQNLTADFGYFVEPAAIGNSAWDDANGNGIQDGAEMPLAGVTVTLQISYPNGTIITQTTVTDASGFYEFGNLLLDENFNGDGSGSEPTYMISVQPPPNFVPTQTDVNGNGNDLEDSDNPFGVAAQPQQGLTDTSIQANPNSEGAIAAIDFGFHAPLRIGNRIWSDLDDDGVYEPNAPEFEPAFAGVVVELLDSAGNPVVDLATGVVITAVTNPAGIYTFARVSSGDYIVRIATSNFDQPGDVLYGFLSSQSGVAVDPVTDPDDDNDDDDDGINNLNPVNGGIQSMVMTMRPGLEPPAEPDEDGLIPDLDSNLTLDFGFFEQLTLGNRVWFDADDDGSIGTLENGVGPGLIMELLDASGNPLLDPNTSLPIMGTTDSNGFYQFSYLFPADYRVRIAAVNFQVGGLLEGYVSSMGSVDPDDDADNDDNGVDNVDPALNGITSDPLTVAYDTEPDGGADGDNNNNTNFTIDFGVTLDPNAVTLLSFSATDMGGLQVNIQWETSAEVDNFGFNLYRSSSDDFGMAEWLVFEPSALAGGNGTGASYGYLDTVLSQGTYYYWLVDVDTSGGTQLHDSVSITVSSLYTIFMPMVIAP